MILVMGASYKIEAILCLQDGRPFPNLAPTRVGWFVDKLDSFYKISIGRF